MALFKKFTDSLSIRKASKTELEGFKAKLKYGDDPMEHWKKSREHYDNYTKHKKLAETLLRTILKPAETDIRDNWSKMEVNFWSHRGKCKESPVGEHVYLHNYGEKNPNRGIQECLCCGKTL